MQPLLIIAPLVPTSGVPRAAKFELGNEMWCRPVSLFFWLTTDATAGSRIFSADVVDCDGNTLFSLFEAPMGPSHKNSKVQMAITKAAIGADTVIWKILPELWLPPKCAIVIVDTNNNGARDTIAMNAVILELWLPPKCSIVIPDTNNKDVAG